MIDYADTKELILFHYLYSTQSLSESAKKSGMSVSGASKLLKSLRRKLEDPLFIRSNSRMYPTEKAKTLYPAARTIVAALTEMHNGADEAFDPGILARKFRILALDVASTFILSAAAQIMETRCPNSSLEIRPLNENYLDDLASWADFAFFAPFTELPSDFESIEIYETSDVVLLRKSHPVMKEKRTPSQFLKALSAYRKIDFLLEFRSNHEEFSPYDQFADSGGQAVALSTPYLWGIPMALQKSNCTALMPDFAARRIAKIFPDLTYVPLRADGTEKFWSVKLIWHRRNDRDPAFTWFRSVLYGELRKAILDV